MTTIIAALLAIALFAIVAYKQNELSNVKSDLDYYKERTNEQSESINFLNKEVVETNSQLDSLKKQYDSDVSSYKESITILENKLNESEDKNKKYLNSISLREATIADLNSQIKELNTQIKELKDVDSSDVKKDTVLISSDFVTGVDEDTTNALSPVKLVKTKRSKKLVVADGEDVLDLDKELKTTNNRKKAKK